MLFKMVLSTLFAQLPEELNYSGWKKHKPQNLSKINCHNNKEKTKFFG